MRAGWFPGGATAATARRGAVGTRVGPEGAPGPAAEPGSFWGSPSLHPAPGAAPPRRAATRVFNVCELLLWAKVLGWIYSESFKGCCWQLCPDGTGSAAPLWRRPVARGGAQVHGKEVAAVPAAAGDSHETGPSGWPFKSVPESSE